MFFLKKGLGGVKTINRHIYKYVCIFFLINRVTLI